MKKILKRLATGFLAFATIVTALPTTAVHASEKQYWTESAERVGIIEKVMNDGSIGSTFNEGYMKVEGETAYCVDINTNFKNGYKTRADASTRMSYDQISDVALSLEYVKQYTQSHSGLNYKQVYLLEQCVVWQRLSVHLGWQCDNVRASYDEIPKAIQDEVYAGAKAFASENKGRYEDITSHIEHMGVRGTSREDVLRQRIKELLPQKFTVGNGIITDCQGKQSRQQDFFVYDAFNSPTFLQTESSCIIPVESVYATIEVKSTLNKDTLRQSVENIKSVKELELSVLHNSPFIPQKYNYIFGAIFAYSSETTIETIAKNLGEFCKEIPYSQQPNIVCILNQGIIIHTPKVEGRQIEITPSEKTTIAIIRNSLELNLYLFYLVLQQHLNTTKNFPPNLLKYAEKSGALNNLQIYIPLEPY